VCGRFEGVDERLIEARSLEEVSLGDFILSGGEIAALALLDACVRLIPGVMGKEASGVEESFADGLLEYPQYTRPAVFEGLGIPDILTSGDHAKVAKWRHSEAERLTRERRPDLWAAYQARQKPQNGPKGSA
jgi:tRNA (guanine37-N1)-methyltransferase